MKVSVLIPCYNVANYLVQCLDSVVNQTYRDLQIVLVDDGSKDNTWQVLQEYAKKDTRVEVYHQENQGVASTRNNLLDKVKGDYVLFIDSDDWMELDMVEFLLDKLTKNNADIAMCGSIINDEPINNEYSEKIYDKKTSVCEFLFHKELRGSLWNKLVKTSLLHKSRFNFEISYGEDALFCWHIFQNINKMIIADRQLYHYRMVSTSLCHSSFGPKKLSSHYAWSQICDETAKWWPQYLNIAQARHCIEDILLLRDAAHDKYKNKEDIVLLQNTIKKLYHTLNEVNITSANMKMYAFVASRCYWLAGKL